MAEEDQASKTEQPTPRRLQQARGRGQVVQSQDLNVWASLAATSLLLATLVPWAAGRLMQLCLPFIERPEQMRVTVEAAQRSLLELLLDSGALAAPLQLALCALGVGVAVAQTGLLFAPQKLKPDFAHLSPMQGLKRILSLRGLFELTKSVLKFAIVAAAVAIVLHPALLSIEAMPTAPLSATLAQIDGLVVRMTAAVAAITALLAGGDYLYQRFSFMQQMRMSKHEVQEEHKQTEGDPHVKGRIRQLRKERARRRMMAAVPKATVVITNPTHYAVALAYDMGKMAAPKLVAKGIDAVALRIREVASKAGVPVFENPPLARTLHRSVEVDDEIPPEHYQAVAQVIGYVMRQRGGRQGT